MSEVRIYMKRDPSGYLAEHPMVFDNTGKGWFYYEDNVEIWRGDWSKGQSWVYLSKECIHHTEAKVREDNEWELVGEL